MSGLGQIFVLEQLIHILRSSPHPHMCQAIRDLTPYTHLIRRQLRANSGPGSTQRPNDLWS